MKRNLIFLMLILATTVISCSKDNDDEIDTNGEAATFTLTLVNNTDRKIFIYFKDSQPNAGFEERGQIVMGEEMNISGLGVRQTYVVRASFNGEDAESFFYEQSVLRQSPTDLTLNIEE